MWAHLLKIRLNLYCQKWNCTHVLFLNRPSTQWRTLKNLKHINVIALHFATQKICIRSIWEFIHRITDLELIVHTHTKDLKKKKRLLTQIKPLRYQKKKKTLFCYRKTLGCNINVPQRNQKARKKPVSFVINEKIDFLYNNLFNS